MTEKLRDTRYAREIASADLGGSRIERIHIKKSDTDEIRFSWWKEGRFQARPLDLSEDDLLILFNDAVKKGVFTHPFLRGLQTMLNGHLGN